MPANRRFSASRVKPWLARVAIVVAVAIVNKWGVAAAMPWFVQGRDWQSELGEAIGMAVLTGSIYLILVIYLIVFTVIHFSKDG
jgi:hypothetical protein